MNTLAWVIYKHKKFIVHKSEAGSLILGLILNTKCFQCFYFTPSYKFVVLLYCVLHFLMTNDGKHFHVAICFSSILFDVYSNLLHIFVLLIFLLLVFFNFYIYPGHHLCGLQGFTSIFFPAVACFIVPLQNKKITLMKTNIQSFLLRIVLLVAFGELLPDTKVQKSFSCGLKGFSFKSDVLDGSIFIHSKQFSLGFILFPGYGCPLIPIYFLESPSFADLLLCLCKNMYWVVFLDSVLFF